MAITDSHPGFSVDSKGSQQPPSPTSDPRGNGTFLGGYSLGRFPLALADLDNARLGSFPRIEQCLISQVPHGPAIWRRFGKRCLDH
jgi:hypothetical protein